jgi:hypothetical protein
MTEPTTDPAAELREENERLRQGMRDLMARYGAAAAAADPEHPVIRKATSEPTFYRTDLADPAFFQLHKAEILKAAATGRIVDDAPSWRIPGSRTQAQRDAAKEIR